MLSKRMLELKPSPTLALAAKAKKLKSEGHDVISLTVGEPDWPSYPKAKEAGKKAIDENKTTYTPASGIPDLKQAISNLVGKQLGMDIKPTQVTVGSGAKFIIYTALTAILDPGDEVILPSPYWVSYPTMVELAGGVPKIVTCDENQNFKMTAAQLESSIGPKTKAVLLNSPSNPTGAEYSEQELAALIEVLEKHPNLVIISDDIYNQLSFNEKALSPHLVQMNKSLFERCISINGMSKAYSMTGWRIGWAVGPEAIIKAMGSFQSQTTGAPSSISQWASVSAINDCHAEVEQALKDLKVRKDFFLDKLANISGVKTFSPEGAFYLWINIKDWLGKTYEGETVADSRKLAELLLEKEMLAVVAGQEFGLDGFLRLSFAASTQDLEQATERMTRFCGKLS